MRSTLGFGVNAQKYQKETAINQQGFDFSAGLRGIDDFAEKTRASADTVAALKANLESLNEIKLKSIEAEFNPFTQVSVKWQQGFASTIAGVITGSQSLSEGLNGMLKSIGDSLANLAAQWITNELFGSLFGMKGLGSSGQQAGGLFSSGGGSGIGSYVSLFSGLIGGFADGGEVQADPGINALRRLPGSIGKALTKEGSNSVLAALTPGERVLTISEARLYNALHPTGIANSTRMPQISNFATGGMANGVGQSSYRDMASNTVNVPVTVNGTDASNIDKVALSNAVRVAVISELATQTRPNGMLSTNGVRFICQFQTLLIFL